MAELNKQHYKFLKDFIRITEENINKEKSLDNFLKLKRVSCDQIEELFVKHEDLSPALQYKPKKEDLPEKVKSIDAF